MINIKQELEVAKKASKIAASLLIDNKDNINKILSNEGRDVKLKADLESEKVIKEYLLVNSNFPILAEESGANQDLGNSFWVVDPLDGTKEFINKTGEFTVNIAMINNKKVVFGIVGAPVTRKIWHGYIFEDVQSQNDSYDKLRIVMSKSHKSDKDKAFLNYIELQNIGYEIIEKGSSLKLCSLADNEADIYPRFGPTSEWDIAAAHAVLNQKGGSVIKIGDYEELTYAKEDSILNPFFIAFRNNSIKSDFLPVLGDFFKKLV